MISWPELVIQEPATISAAGTSATSGGMYRRASSQVGKTTAQTMKALIALAIAYDCVSESVTSHAGAIA